MKRALVLSGGGARGAFQAPVVDLLLENDIEFDHIFGVSVGSLNGALASTGCKNLTEVWEEIDKKNVFGGSLSYGLLGKIYRIGKVLLNFEKSFYDNDPLVKLVENHYDPSETDTSFSFGTVSLRTGRFETFSVHSSERKDSLDDLDEETIIKYIVASASIPTVFPPVFGEYVDGGLKNIAPVASAVNRGAEEIYVVTTENITSDRTTIEEPDSLFSIGKISLNIALNEIINNDYETTKKINELVEQASESGVELTKKNGDPYRKIDLKLIQPKKDLGSALDFSDGLMKERINSGKKQAKKFFNKGRG